MSRDGAYRIILLFSPVAFKTPKNISFLLLIYCSGTVGMQRQQANKKSQNCGNQGFSKKISM